MWESMAIMKKPNEHLGLTWIMDPRYLKLSLMGMISSKDWSLERNISFGLKKWRKKYSLLLILWERSRNIGWDMSLQSLYIWKGKLGIGRRKGGREKAESGSIFQEEGMWCITSVSFVISAPLSWPLLPL